VRAGLALTGLCALLAFALGGAARAAPSGTDLFKAGKQIDDAIYAEQGALYALLGSSTPDAKSALSALDQSDSNLHTAGGEIGSNAHLSGHLDQAETNDDVARTAIKDGRTDEADDLIAKAIDEKEDALDDVDDLISVVFAAVYGIKDPDAGPSSLFGIGDSIFISENEKNKISRYDLYPPWRAPSSAAPKPKIVEYTIPTANAHPQSLAFGPDGSIWFTEESGNKIARISPEGKITEFPLPSFEEPYDIVAGPDHALWFTLLGTNKIGRMTTSGKETEYALPHGGSAPEGITVGPDHALWFVEELGNRIGRITTSGKLTEFPLAGNPGPANIVTGPDHALWFTEYNTSKVGRITTAGKVTQISTQNANEGPDGICVAPDGKTIAFTNYNESTVGFIRNGKLVSEKYVGGNPTSIVPGPGGDVWFVEYKGNSLGHVAVP